MTQEASISATHRLRRTDRAATARTQRLAFYAPPVLVWLFVTGLLALMARLGPQVLHFRGRYHILLPPGERQGYIGDWIASWFRFDSGWYVGVAQHGYHWGGLGKANTNFFPLYPILIRLVQPVTHNSAWLSALIVANVAHLVALIFLWRWALLRWDREVALRTVLLASAFPFSYFFITPYAEPVFLAVAAAAMFWAEQGRWELATIAAGFATVARPVGLAVVVALILFALHRRDKRRAALACTALLPIAAFIVYLGIATGHPLGFLTYHSAGWVAPHGGLLNTIGSQFHTRLAPLDRIDAFLAVLFLASGVVAWRRFEPAYGALILVGAILPLIHGLVSMERYVIVLFPAFAVWATWKSRIGQAIIFMVSFLVLILATMMYSSGFALF